MSDSAARPARPALVAIVAAIAFMSGVMGIAAGIIGLASPAPDTPALNAIVDLAVGLFSAIVSVALFLGNRAARIATTVILSIRIVASLVFSLVTAGELLAYWILLLVMSAIGILILWTKTSSAWFRR